MIGGAGVVLLLLGGVFFGFSFGREWENWRLRETFKEAKRVSGRIYLLVLVLAVLLTGSGVVLTGVPSLPGHPALIGATEQIEGTIYPYQLIKGRLLFSQVKDDEVVCRIVDWERFHPIERSKIILPELKGYTFINTAHGIEVKQKQKEAPVQ